MGREKVLRFQYRAKFFLRTWFDRAFTSIRQFPEDPIGKAIIMLSRKCTKYDKPHFPPSHSRSSAANAIQFSSILPTKRHFPRLPTQRLTGRKQVLTVSSVTHDDITLIDHYVEHYEAPSRYLCSMLINLGRLYFLENVAGVLGLTFTGTGLGYTVLVTTYYEFPSQISPSAY